MSENNKNEWKISVITVCYNSKKTIEDTIKSVLNQTYQNYEYIIIDGCSTDGTIDLVKSYIPKFNGRLTFISEPDKGIYNAMNKGIRKATGDLICLLNSDDYYELDAFETMNANYNGEKYKIQYGLQRVITNGKEEMCIMKNHQFLCNAMIPHQTCFVTRETYRKFGLFDESFRSAADYEFTVRVSRHKEVIFQPIYKIIVCFRSGGMSESLTGALEEEVIMKKYGFIGEKKYLYLVTKARITHLLHKI